MSTLDAEEDAALVRAVGVARGFIAEGYDARLRVGGPEAVTLTVCESCNRNDRWQQMKERHYSEGSLCPGPIRKVVYVMAPALPGRSNP